MRQRHFLQEAAREGKVGSEVAKISHMEELEPMLATAMNATLATSSSSQSSRLGKTSSGDGAESVKTTLLRHLPPVIGHPIGNDIVPTMKRGNATIRNYPRWSGSQPGDGQDRDSNQLSILKSVYSTL